MKEGSHHRLHVLDMLKCVLRDCEIEMPIQPKVFQVDRVELNAIHELGGRLREVAASKMDEIGVQVDSKCSAPLPGDLDGHGPVTATQIQYSLSGKIGALPDAPPKLLVRMKLVAEIGAVLDVGIRPTKFRGLYARSWS